MSQASATRPKQEIGLPVSDFSLPLIGSGGQHKLGEFLEGKQGAVVVFWSGVCSHCVRYDQYLNAFAARHPEIGLAVIASRHGETAEMIQATAAQRKLGFSILHDPPGVVARDRKSVV